MNVKVRNFKSIEELEFPVAPLTILLGPPASGKSNILDALALAGYFNRILLIDKEYGNNGAHLEPPNMIFRYQDVRNVFRFGDLARRITVDVVDDTVKQSVELMFSGGALNILVNGVSIPWNLTLTSDVTGIRNALNQAYQKGAIIASRVYGYDRFGLSLNTCHSVHLCGFALRLKGSQQLPYPTSIFSEVGWNATRFLLLVRDILYEMERYLKEDLEVDVEIRISRSGTIMVYDGLAEVDVESVSDSVFRTLYYAMAIRTSVNFVKQYGLEGRFMLLLEEPESHIFPYFMKLLAESIVEASKHLYVIVTTHNPLLVSLLWRRGEAGRTKTLFVSRARGSTVVHELDMKRLAEDLVTPEDILFMLVNEVLEKYAIEPEAREGKEAG